MLILLCIMCLGHEGIIFAMQASTNPLRVLVQHLRDDKYSATDDVIKVHRIQ